MCNRNGLIAVVSTGESSDIELLRQQMLITKPTMHQCFINKVQDRKRESYLFQQLVKKNFNVIFTTLASYVSHNNLNAYWSLLFFVLVSSPSSRTNKCFFVDMIYRDFSNWFRLYQKSRNFSKWSHEII
jgi:hypothetical protein